MSTLSDDRTQELADEARRHGTPVPGAADAEDRASLALYALLDEALREDDPAIALPADFADRVAERATPPERFSVFESVLVPVLVVALLVPVTPLVAGALGEAVRIAAGAVAPVESGVRWDLVLGLAATALLAALGDRLLGRRRPTSTDAPAG